MKYENPAVFSLLKPDIEETFKNGKEMPIFSLSLFFFCLGKESLLPHINILLIVTYIWFIFVILNELTSIF